MWLLAEMDPGEPTYHITWTLWLDGELKVEALQQAWDAALAKHEALRTTFRNDSGVPVQVIEDEPAPAPMVITSVEGLAESERAPAALELLRGMARTPFDLAAGPLARASLIRLSPHAHVLVVVMHHIVADGWSFRILLDELSADYEAIVEGGEPSGAEPPIQYADFAIWQMERAEEGGNAAAERFWRSELAGAPTTLPLPADRPYPARQTFAGERIITSLDADLTASLRQLATRLETSLFAVLLSAYALVLSRLSGNDDLLIAVPMAARTRSETESVVGLFVNTVPTRVRIDPDRTLGELVKSVHATAVRALEHQELPFARVVELIRPDRDPARLPLAQVMFAFEEPWDMPDRGGLRWRSELVENDTAKFELELTVTDAANGPRLRFNRNRNLFDPATGQLVADGFLTVLRGLCERPDRTVADTEIMSASTLSLVLSQWPDGGPVSGLATTALALVWAACSGDSVVAIGNDGSLTGDEVRALARRITAAVRERGVGVGDRVAILLPRGARLIPAILGIWAAGASFVPLDSIYPAQRIAAMLEDSGASAILIDSVVPDAPVVPPSAATIAVVDLGNLTTAEAEPLLDLPPSAVAVTIFTSGSTGRPKAVSNSQGGVAAVLAAIEPVFALGPQDRFLAVSTFTFDIALAELIAPLLAGGCSVIAEAWQVLDSARLREIIADNGITAMQATPAGWRMLIDAGGVPDTVKLRLAAGEPLSRDLADAVGTGFRLWNLYGPTETTIYSGGDLVDPSPAPIEIGSIIAGTRHYVLDDRMRPVPPGVFGEVYIGGDLLANGYHGAPGMTASKFLPDPFSDRPGARLYRTGDIGRWRFSGKMELAGRADRQIKIRGYRIESGEIETVLRGHPGVAQAVVSVRRTGADVRLVAYLVTRGDIAGLQQHLRETLPEYMIPAAFVTLPGFPLTGSGKIDHRALPEPEWGPAPDRVTTAPRTQAESQIAAIVAEVLTLSVPIGVDDNFFALGGHSLTATRLLARIRSDFGVDVPIRTFFSDPTVGGLAAALSAAREGGPVPAAGR